MKKGSIKDVLLIPIIVISLVLVAMVMGHLFRAVDTPETDYFNDTPEGQAMRGIWYKFYNVLDYAFVSLWVFMLIAGIIVAYLLRSHPIFIPFALFMTAFLIALSVGIKEIWENINNVGVLSVEVASFGLTGLWFNNLPIITLFSCAIIMFVVYALGGEER